MTQSNVVLDETLVQARAFELWQARGCPIGSPERDWIAAQRLLEGEGRKQEHETPPALRPSAAEAPGPCERSESAMDRLQVARRADSISIPPNAERLPLALCIREPLASDPIALSPSSGRAAVGMKSPEAAQAAVDSPSPTRRSKRRKANVR